MRKPNITPALIKKLKLYIAPIKSKKRPIITPAILDEIKSNKEISLVNKSENK
jgi:hypothetical protein